LVDGDECQRFERRHNQQQPDKVHGRMRGEHQQLDMWVPAAHAPVAVTAQGPDAFEVQVKSLQHQQRKEQPRLPAGDEPAKTAGARGDLLGGEGQHPVTDVGVVIFLVGVCVMPVVLANPPAVAKTNQQIPNEPAEQVIRTACGEHLLVTAVVTEERDLGERDTENDGRDALQPRIPDPDDGRPAGRVETEADCHSNSAGNGSPLEQPSAADLPSERGVVATP